MQDPEFRAALEEIEPAYQVARLRIMRGLTQKQLAKLVGTRQSSISRLESGDKQPSLSFLRRIVNALGGQLKVRILSQEEAAAARQDFVPTANQSNIYSEKEPIEVSNWPQTEKHRYYFNYHVSATAQQERLVS